MYGKNISLPIASAKRIPKTFNKLVFMYGENISLPIASAKRIPKIQNSDLMRKNSPYV